MAKTITQVGCSLPTGITVSLVAGGSLPVGTTYYYRFISWRLYRETHAFSEASTEYSVTTTSGNQQVDISWTPGTDATGVIIQRTTTSGSYPIGGANNFGGQITNGVRLNYPIVIANVVTSISDDGTVLWDNPNLDHSQAWPVISATSDANDVITPDDIYQASVAGGWGQVEKIFVPSGKSVTTSTIVEQLPYVFTGCLYLRDCIWQVKGITIMLQGTIQTYSGTVTLRYGSSDTRGRSFPYTFMMSPFYMSRTDDATTGYVNLPFKWRDCNGKAGSYIYNLIRRPLLSTNNILPYIFSGQWDDGIAIGSTDKVEKSILGNGSANGCPIFKADYSDNTFEGMRHYFENEIADATVRYAGEGLTHRWRQNTIFLRPRTTSMNKDCTWGQGTFGAMHIDPTYEARGQTDNQPYFSVGTNQATYIGCTLTINNTIKVKVVDTDGNPIDGATVSITDQNGYSDLWEDLGTYTNTIMTPDVTTINLLDRSKVSVDDVIRFGNYAERIRVDSTGSGEGLINITRGHQGTTARTINYGGASATYNWWKQINTPLTTDSDGEAEPDKPLLWKELYVAKSGGSYFQGGYENDLVTQGWIGRNKTVHTLTISKAGYQTYSSIIDMDVKKDMVVTLNKQNQAIIAKGIPAVNADPANPNNEIYV